MKLYTENKKRMNERFDNNMEADEIVHAVYEFIYNKISDFIYHELIEESLSDVDDKVKGYSWTYSPESGEEAGLYGTDDSDIDYSIMELARTVAYTYFKEYFVRDFAEYKEYAASRD